MLDQEKTSFKNKKEQMPKFNSLRTVGVSITNACSDNVASNNAGLNPVLGHFHSSCTCLDFLTVWC